MSTEKELVREILQKLIKLEEELKDFEKPRSTLDYFTFGIFKKKEKLNNPVSNFR